jgi:hypothetical protein
MILFITEGNKLTLGTVQGSRDYLQLSGLFLQPNVCASLSQLSLLVIRSAASSSLPHADVVSTLANLVGSLRLPVRDSFKSTVVRSLAFFPNSETFFVILNILAGLVQMCEISLRSESPWRSTS